MTSQREVAAILALCITARNAIEAVELEAKAVVDCSYGEEKVCGVVPFTVDGETRNIVVGSTGRYLRRPREPFTILDDAAFVEWVVERYPTEVVSVVRPAFMKSLAEQAEKTGGVLCDADGVVCDAVKLNDQVVSVRTYVKRSSEALAALDQIRDTPISELADRIKELAVEDEN